MSNTTSNTLIKVQVDEVGIKDPKKISRIMTKQILSEYSGNIDIVTTLISDNATEK